MTAEPPPSPLTDPVEVVAVPRAVLDRLWRLAVAPARFNWNVGDGVGVGYVRSDDVLVLLRVLEPNWRPPLFLRRRT